MIKGTSTILTLWNPHIKETLYYQTISKEIPRISQATSSVVQFIKTSKVFLHRMVRQGVDPVGVKKV